MVVINQVLLDEYYKGRGIIEKGLLLLGAHLSKEFFQVFYRPQLHLPV